MSLELNLYLGIIEVDDKTPAWTDRLYGLLRSGAKNCAGERQGTRCPLGVAENKL
jgi:hypothetical protein